MSLTPPIQVDPVRDQRIERLVPLVAPQTLLDELPLSRRVRPRCCSAGGPRFTAVLDGRDDRLLVVVGPCSVHDVDATRDYAQRLAAEARELRDELLIAMRVYFEKPRTTIGWKGLINDPASGRLRRRQRRPAMARRLLLEVLELGLPVGCEFLDPITPQYISDAVCWGAIGARTAESQIHRQLGSGLSMPVGFKNRTDGNVQVAVDAVRAAAAPHAFAGIDVNGTPAILHTRGNPDCHIILRGGRGAPNYDAERSPPRWSCCAPPVCRERLMIDLSHDNSGKDPERQPAVADAVAAQIAAGNRALVGVMLESFLARRPPGSGSRADAALRPVDHRRCIGWETTVEVLDGLCAVAVRARLRAGADPSSGERMRIAVIGVGLIGGSIALARSRACSGPSVAGYDRRPPALRRRSSGARSTRRADRSRPRSPGARQRSSRCRVGCAAGGRGELLAAAPGRTVSSAMSARPSGAVVAALRRPAVRRRASAGRSGDRGRRARPGRPVRRRYLVSDAGAPRPPGVLYERLHRMLGASARSPAAIDAETHDAMLALRLAPAARARQRARRPRRRSRSPAGGRAMPATGPSFRDATRVAGAPSAIWTDIYMSNRDALLAADGLSSWAPGGRALGCSRWRRRRRSRLERRARRRSPRSCWKRSSPAASCTSCGPRYRTGPGSSPSSRSRSGGRA